MSKLKVAVLDMNAGVKNLGLDSIKSHLQAFGSRVDYDVYDVRLHNELPGLEYDAYISSGGPGDPRESDDAWEINYFQWLKSVNDYNLRNPETAKQVFLICHSFQLGVRFFKVGELRKRFHISFGTFPCYLTGNGIHESIFDGLPNPMYVADFRQFEVVWPHFDSYSKEFPKVLAIEQLDITNDRERAIMAIRFTDDIIGTQFHPEAYADGMYAYFNEDERREQVISEHGAGKLNQMIHDLQNPQKIALTNAVVLPNFIKGCFRKIESKLQSVA